MNNRQAHINWSFTPCKDLCLYSITGVHCFQVVDWIWWWDWVGLRRCNTWVVLPPVKGNVQPLLWTFWIFCHVSIRPECCLSLSDIINPLSNTIRFHTCHKQIYDMQLMELISFVHSTKMNITFTKLSFLIQLHLDQYIHRYLMPSKRL